MSYTLSNWDGSQSKKSGSKKPTESSTNIHSSVSIQKSLNLEQNTNLATAVPSHTTHFLDLPSSLNNSIPTLVHYDTVWFDASNTHTISFGRPGPALDPPATSHGLDIPRVNDSVQATNKPTHSQHISAYQQHSDPEASLMPITKDVDVDSTKIDDRIEGMSVFSAEAEFEEDNGEDDASLSMLVDYISEKSSPAPPPARDASRSEILQNVYNLFTPSPVLSTFPLPISNSPQLDTAPTQTIRRTRHFMTYVDVPPLPKGVNKSAYRPLRKKGTKRAQKYSATSVQSHSSLAAAMEASFKGNREIGSLSSKPNAFAGSSKISSSLPHSRIARKRRVDDVEDSDFVPVTKKSKSKPTSAKRLDDKKLTEPRKRILVKPKDRLDNDTVSVVFSRPKNKAGQSSFPAQSKPLGKTGGRPPKQPKETIEHLLTIDDEVPYVSTSVYIHNSRYLRQALNQATVRPWTDMVGGCEAAEEEGGQEKYLWLSAFDRTTHLPQPDDNDPQTYILGSWSPLQYGSEDGFESNSVVDITDQLQKTSAQSALNQRPKKDIIDVDSFRQNDPTETLVTSQPKHASLRHRSNSAIIPETETSFSGDDNEIEVVVRPSAKALGKRKASSPIIYSVPDSPAPSFQHSPPGGLLLIDGEPYLDDLEASQRHAHELYPEFALEDILDHSHPTDYPSQHLQSPSTREIPRQDFESTIDNHDKNIFNDLDYEAIWIPSEHENAISYDTIDPTLLGGGHDMTQSTDHQEKCLPPASPPSGRDPSSAPPSSSSNSSSSSKSPALATSNSMALPLQVDSPSDENPASIIIKPRLRRQRRHPDMIPITSVELDLDSASSYVPESDIDGSYAGGITAVAKKPPDRPAPGIKSDKKVAMPAKHGERPIWATGGFESYCHQCRTKTNKLKMICRCNKQYCNRCIAFRYPNITFARKFPGSCPVCEGNCNCDICCRKRGEEFVSSRKTSQLSATPLPPFIHVPIDPVTYWGAVYSLEGEKIANAFVGADGNEDIVVACPVKITRRRPRKRVFVGTIRPSWGLGRNPTITEYKPDPPPKPTKTKAKPTPQPVRIRFYVGNSFPLFLPFRPDDLEADDYFGKEFGSSPLSSLDSDKEEEVASFSPDSLGDVDVSRAINLALHSLQS